jgi:4-amino-4-deoxy-L-arabinose transferase-like glycosyltransferase
MAHTISLKKIVFPVRYFPLILMLVYAAYRILLINFNATETGDSNTFLQIAKDFSNGDFLSIISKPPLLPFLNGLLAFLIDVKIAGRILVSLASISSVAIFYLLLRELEFGIGLSSFAMLLFGLNPLFLAWSGRVFAEPLYTLFIILAFLIFFKKSFRLRNLALSICVLAAVLSRYEGVILLLLFLAIFLIRKKYRSLAWLASVNGGAIALGLLIIVVSGVKIGALNYAISLSLYHPPKQVLELFTYLIFVYGLSSILIMQIRGFRSLWQNDKKKMIIFSLFVVLSLSVIYLIGFSPRLLYPLLPVLILLAAYGIRDMHTIDRRMLLIFSLLIAALFIPVSYFFKTLYIAGNITGVVLWLIASICFVTGLYYGKNSKFSTIMIIASVILVGIMSFNVLNQQKNIYITTQQAVNFLKDQKRVAYSDETGVTGLTYGDYWHLTQRIKEIQDQLKWLEERKPDFILITNEFDERSTFSTLVENEKYRDKFLLIKCFTYKEKPDLLESFVLRLGLIRTPSQLGLKETKTCVYKVMP